MREPHCLNCGNTKAKHPVPSCLGWSVYPCMQDDCTAAATHFAVNNVPILGHVCTLCLALQPAAEREHFAERVT